MTTAGDVRALLRRLGDSEKEVAHALRNYHGRGNCPVCQYLLDHGVMQPRVSRSHVYWNDDGEWITTTSVPRAVSQFISAYDRGTETPPIAAIRVRTQTTGPR